MPRRLFTLATLTYPTGSHSLDPVSVLLLCRHLVSFTTSQINTPACFTSDDPQEKCNYLIASQAHLQSGVIVVSTIYLMA